MPIAYDNIKDPAYDIVYPPGVKDLSDQLSTEELVRRLKICASVFQSLGQTDNVSSYENFALLIVSEDFISHGSKEVRLLVACIIVDVFRVFAPEPPYKDPEILKTIFEFILEELKGIKAPSNIYFQRHFYLLECLAWLKAFNICFDIEGGQEILQNLFKLFFNIINSAHSAKVKNYMLDVMTAVLIDIDAPNHKLLEAILINLCEPHKSQKREAYALARDLIKRTEHVLEPFIQAYITSILFPDKDKSLTTKNEYEHQSDAEDEDTTDEKIKKPSDSSHATTPKYREGKVYDFIHELYIIAPQLLANVINLLEFKLRSNKVEERAQICKALGRMLSDPSSSLITDNVHLWRCFLGRFNDVDPGIRLTCVRFASHLLTQLYDNCVAAGATTQQETSTSQLFNSLETARHDLIEVLVPRAYDPDENVRYEFVLAIVRLATLTHDPAVLTPEQQAKSAAKKTFALQSSYLFRMGGTPSSTSSLNINNTTTSCESPQALTNSPNDSSSIESDEQSDQDESKSVNKSHKRKRHSTTSAKLSTSQTLNDAERLLECLKSRTLDKKYRIRREAVLGLGAIYKHLYALGTVNKVSQQCLSNPEERSQLYWIRDRIMHTYYQNSLEDQILVEKTLHACFVPNALPTQKRMLRLLHFFINIDENSVKAMTELFKRQLYMRFITKQYIQIKHQLLYSEEYSNSTQSSSQPTIDQFTNEIRVKKQWHSDESRDSNHPDSTNADAKKENELYQKSLQKLFQLSKMMPDSLKTFDNLKKFDALLTADPKLFKEFFHLIQDSNLNCKESCSLCKNILKHTGNPQATNILYTTIKQYLERVTPLLFDKESIAYLCKLIVPFTLLKAKSSNSPLITNSPNKSGQDDEECSVYDENCPIIPFVEKETFSQTEIRAELNKQQKKNLKSNEDMNEKMLSTHIIIKRGFNLLQILSRIYIDYFTCENVLHTFLQFLQESFTIGDADELLLESQCSILHILAIMMKQYKPHTLHLLIDGEAPRNSQEVDHDNSFAKLVTSKFLPLLLKMHKNSTNPKQTKYICQNILAILFNPHFDAKDTKKASSSHFKNILKNLHKYLLETLQPLTNAPIEGKGKGLLSSISISKLNGAQVSCIVFCRSHYEACKLNAVSRSTNKSLDYSCNSTSSSYFISPNDQVTCTPQNMDLSTLLNDFYIQIETVIVPRLSMSFFGKDNTSLFTAKDKKIKRGISLDSLIIDNLGATQNACCQILIAFLKLYTHKLIGQYYCKINQPRTNTENNSLSPSIELAKTDLVESLNEFYSICFDQILSATYKKFKYNNYITEEEFNLIKLKTTCLLIKLIQIPYFWEKLTLDHYHVIAYLPTTISDLAFKQRFIYKLHKALLAFKLPLDYLAIFALTPLESDRDYRLQVKQYLISNINKRRDVFKELSFKSGSNTQNQAKIHNIMPDYVIPYVIHLLSYWPSFTDIKSIKLLEKIKECIWFVLEPLVSKNENYTFTFFKRLIENIKQTDDALNPENNEKLYVVCDIALGLIWTRSTNFILKDFPTKPMLPSRMFRKPEQGISANNQFYLPKNYAFSPPRKKVTRPEIQQFFNLKTTPPHLIKTPKSLIQQNETS